MPPCFPNTLIDFELTLLYSSRIKTAVIYSLCIVALAYVNFSLIKWAGNYSFMTVNHRLCVFASGSLITVICSSFASIKLSRLHFGQYRGKFLKIVSFLILSRVLLPQTGHKTHPASILIVLIDVTI